MKFFRLERSKFFDLADQNSKFVALAAPIATAGEYFYPNSYIFHQKFLQISSKTSNFLRATSDFGIWSFYILPYFLMLDHMSMSNEYEWRGVSEFKTIWKSWIECNRLLIWQLAPIARRLISWYGIGAWALSAIKFFYYVILIEHEFTQLSIFGAKKFTQ